MKILISHDLAPAWTYVRTGWARALLAGGHDVRLWNMKQKPAFHVFQEFVPDILITQTYNIDRALYKCIARHPEMKVIATASNWGDIDDSIDRVKYPVVFINDNEKKIIEELRKATGKPDYLFCHYHENSLSTTMNRWTSELGIPVFSSMNAADVFSYCGGEYKASLACDLSMTSGYWPYKAVNLNKYILPLCYHDKYHVKIWGTNWPVKQYCGMLDEANAKHVFLSTKINLNCHEPHSTEYHFDVNERPFKVLAAGGFLLECGYVKSLHEDTYQTAIPYIANDNPLNKLSVLDEMIFRIEHYLANEQERNDIAKALQTETLQRHTYFDRMSDMLWRLGLTDDAYNLTKQKTETLNTIYKGNNE